MSDNLYQEFLTVEMWDILPKPAQRSMALEFAGNWSGGRLSVIEGLYRLKSEKYLVYHSWKLFGIFAEIIIDIKKWHWSTVIHRFHQDTEANRDYEYPHIAMFEYLLKLKEEPTDELEKR